MSWRPDESSVQLETETAWLQGCVLTGVAYGVVLMLVTMCIQTLWARIRTPSTRTRKSVFLLFYVIVIAMLATILFVTNTAFVQMGFINNRNYPGGPAAYIETMFSVPDNVASCVPIVLANWFGNSLMLWRCMIIYKDCKIRTKVLVVALPGVILMGSIALGILWLIQVSSPRSSPALNAATGISYTASYFGVALAVNISVTLLIVSRLLLHRHRVTKVFGSGRGSHYTSIAAIIVESASLYSVFSLLFLIPFGLNNPVSNTFLQILGEVDIIASLLIIYRVLQGKAWSNDTPTKWQVHSGNERSVRMDRLSATRTATPDSQIGAHLDAMEIKVDVQVEVDSSDILRDRKDARC
ncbi:hypothetical protein BV22DRAFT_1018335 [Leucogyrophana mollusca]|uniref:Uncharacterized protein n=1 Tax=Leucogyrophana mollusca TaxID=85980 RepID=A0ACB8BAG2_9AGAM|nr:hypothetical protein BV22DRAFT_1018335 [Leucogyrophana mollusca]